jgi:hypothetical protein
LQAAVRGCSIFLREVTASPNQADMKALLGALIEDDVELQHYPRRRRWQ